MTQLPPKKDIINSLVLGELIFLFFLPFDRVVGVFEKSGLEHMRYIFAFAMPAATAGGYVVLFAIGKRIRIFIQLARYGLIGVTNTVMTLGIVNFLFLSTGVYSGYVADIFSAIAFFLVVTNSFFWNKYWTFNEGGGAKTGREYIQFFAVSISGALINVFVFHTVVNILGPQWGFSVKAWANVAVAIGIPISLAWNFTGYR